MSAGTIVHCRLCKQPFDREKLQKGVDWIMPSRNYYYHKKCYDDWIVDKDNTKAQRDDEVYVDYIYDFLAHDLKVEYNFGKCESQRKNYIKNRGYNNKGIYFALKYYYEVQHNSWEKSLGGIGIVPYIYTTSREYWMKQAQDNIDIIEKIVKQMEERRQRPTITVKANRSKDKNKKRKAALTWEELEALTDE